MKLYQYHLKDSGVVAIHISNKYVDLKPVILRHIQSFKMSYRYLRSPFQVHMVASEWVLLSKREPSLEPILSIEKRFYGVAPLEVFDDESNSIFPLIKYKF